MRKKLPQKSPIKLTSFDTLRTLGKSIFTPESMQNGITQDHVQQAREFLSKGASVINPTVMASYWGHVMIASELGKRIAEQIKKYNKRVNPLEIEFLLLLHDVGRLVIPDAYLRNDFIGNRLLVDVGIPSKMRRKIPSVGKLLVIADELNFTERQLTFEESLTVEQQQMAHVYFSSLSPTQRIVNLADNLGKGGSFGVFNHQQFINYLKTQEDRYSDQDSAWASIHWAITDERRKKGAILQTYVVEKTQQWLETMGVNFKEMRNGLIHSGPRFVIIARHGELYNPTNIVYNRDNVMAKKDIIHLDKKGEEQMRKLGQLIKKRGLIVTEIDTSPEIRAIESSKELQLEVAAPIYSTDDLDDVYAPGPYREGMTMDQLMTMGGNVYEASRWGKYMHENHQSVIERMRTAFWKLAQKLKANEAGIVVSHGDPIAWFANTTAGQTIPNPEELRNLIYPAKGEGLLAVVTSDNSLFTLYTLKDATLETSKKIY